MIKFKEVNSQYGYCNVCQSKEEKKFYELHFFNSHNQGMAVGLCESCLNTLTIKLMRKEVDNNDK